MKVSIHISGMAEIGHLQAELELMVKELEKLKTEANMVGGEKQAKGSVNITFSNSKMIIAYEK